MRNVLILAAFGVAMSLAAPAMASEDLPDSTARRLDKQTAEYTWSAAAERRHMIIRESMRQQRYGRGGYGHGPRHGYGRGYGYGYGPRRHGPPPGYYRRGW